MRKKDILRLGRGLNGHAPPSQIGKRIDIAVAAHRDHLTADHVRRGPAVLIFAAVNGETAPNAVDFAAFHQLFFRFPVDDRENGLIPHARKGFRCQIHVDARGPSVHIFIIIRRVIITADDDHGFHAFIRFIYGFFRAASA